MERYKNTEEFKSEFGDYRVNDKTENLCDMSAPYPIEEVTNDPFTEQAENK